MKIGNIEPGGFAALAPMAGVADSVFRELCVSYGAGFVTGEMVSAKGIDYGDRKSDELLVLSEGERPAAVQLFGSDPEIMARSAAYSLKFSPEAIDINMGCPAPKVTKNGCGSVLMKNPALAAEIAKAVVRAVPVPVTAKIRTGWDDNSKNCVELAKMLEDAGVAAITVHGRTREQMYAPPADLEMIRRVKQAVSVPVIGNGDIFTPADAKRMYEYTGCDYVALGRGALGRPWIFSQINEYMRTGVVTPEPSVSEKMEVMLLHAGKICEKHGEKYGMREIRKHALWYTKGLRGGAKLRNEFSTVSSFDELKTLAEKAEALSEEKDRI